MINNLIEDKMDKNSQRTFEDKALDIANAQLDVWEHLLKEMNIELDEVTIIRKNDNENYSSLMQFTLWQGRKIESAFSINLISDGNQVVNLSDIPRFIDKEIIVVVESNNE